MSQAPSFKLLADLKNFVLHEDEAQARDFVHGSQQQEELEKKSGKRQVAQANSVGMQKKDRLQSWAQDFQKKSDTSKDLGNKAAASISGALQDFVVHLVKGGESLLNAMSNLGKALLRGVLDMVANDMFTKAAIDLVIAIALLAGIYTAGNAPQYFIGAAVLLATGFGLKALEAAFMAKGGLVMKPTLTVLGEAGPEIVIPADRFKEFGLGGTEVGSFRANFPNFTDFQQAASPTFATTIASELQFAHQAAGG
jgi:hypothetical protein